MSVKILKITNITIMLSIQVPRPFWENRETQIRMTTMDFELFQLVFSLYYTAIPGSFKGVIKNNWYREKRFLFLKVAVHSI